ncbi:hypothetical protein [Microbacterium sp. USHLN186]|uniref:hypothetical protein n=1 Tax=Microbacterium sp. USHLN186 TaxID=3081286 RepID=UPI003017F51F
MRTDDLASSLDALADVLIPGSEEWPAPSELMLGADLLGRLRERETKALRAAVTTLVAAGWFTSGTVAERVALMSEFAEREPVLFELLRRCVYYGYYAQPRVVGVLRALGYDFNEAPQPRGYRMDPLTAKDVAGVDTRRLVWIPADRVGTVLRRAS